MEDITIGRLFLNSFHLVNNMSENSENDLSPSRNPTEEEALLFAVVCTIVAPFLPIGCQCVLDLSIEEGDICAIYLEDTLKKWHKLCYFCIGVNADRRFLGTFNFKSNFPTGRAKANSKSRVNPLEYDFQSEIKAQNVSNLVRAVSQYAIPLQMTIKAYVEALNALKEPI